MAPRFIRRPRQRRIVCIGLIETRDVSPGNPVEANPGPVGLRSAGPAQDTIFTLNKLPLGHSTADAVARALVLQPSPNGFPPKTRFRSDPTSADESNRITTCRCSPARILSVDLIVSTPLAPVGIRLAVTS